MNDPYEFKGFYFNGKKADGWGISRQQQRLAEKLLRVQERSFMFASLSASAAKNSLPMWHHYANGHKGFCVVYDVFDSSKLFPVVYESKPIDATYIACDALQALKRELFDPAFTSTHENISIRLSILPMFLKQSDWSYEQEIRLLAPSCECQFNAPGYNISLASAGLRTAHVIAGSDCSPSNLTCLKSICRDVLACPLLQARYGQEQFLLFEELEF